VASGSGFRVASAGFERNDVEISISLLNCVTKLNPDMSTVCTGANRGVSRYLTENYPGLGIFT
jgi:hypothetical protein